MIGESTKEAGMPKPAEYSSDVITGRCWDERDNGRFTYTLQNGVLTFTGSGRLSDNFDFYCFDDDDSAIIRYCDLYPAKKIVIGEGCTAIGSGMFDVNRGWVGNDNYNWIQLEDPYEAEFILIPEGVKEIGERAFAGCIHVKQLVIPDTVVTVGKDAFLDVPCIVYNGPARSDTNWGAVSAFRMKNNVLHIHSRGSLTSVPRLNAEEVVIHEGCTDIGAFAFKDWESLDTVHTPFSLRHIDQNAFSGCHDVTLDMRNTRPVWNSTKNVFSGVYRVFSWLPRRIEGDTLYIGPDDEETPYILQMRDEGVYGMNWMEPDTWERYKGCPWGSRRIHKIRAAEIAPGCQEIGESVFYGHTALETVKIPMGVRTIGMFAFAGCENLKVLEIPDSVTEIGRNAFRDVPHIIYHGPAQSEDNWGAKSRN